MVTREIMGVITVAANNIERPYWLGVAGVIGLPV